MDYGGCLQAIESRGALKYKVTDTRSKRLKDRYGQQYRETDRTVKRTLIKPLFVPIWKKQQLPDDWTEGVIVRFPKKRSPKQLERGHCFVPSKILAGSLNYWTSDSDKSTQNFEKDPRSLPCPTSSHNALVYQLRGVRKDLRQHPPKMSMAHI